MHFEKQTENPNYGVHDYFIDIIIIDIIIIIKKT